MTTDGWICIYHYWDGMMTGFYDDGSGVHWFDLDEDSADMIGTNDPSYRTYNVWKVDYASVDVDFTFKPCWDPDFQVSEEQLLELKPVVDPPKSSLPPGMELSLSRMGPG